MAWFRRKPAPPVAPGTDIELAPKVDRTMLALAAYTQHLDGRLETLERRLDETAMSVPTHADVLEVRVHSARLAAELARVTVELRAEIDELAQPIKRDQAKQDRIQELAEQIIQLSDSLKDDESDGGNESTSETIDLTQQKGGLAATA